MPADSVSNVFVTTHNTIEGSAAHENLEKKIGFSYRCLLGDLMYAYVTCRPDIGYSICCRSKFSTCLSELHYNFLEGVAISLKRTKHLGILYYWQAPTKHAGLDPGCLNNEPLPLPDGYPVFPDHPAGPDPICFVDAAYVNDLHKRRSTTGYANMLAGGAIAWRSKTQSTTAFSSTNTEFYAAVAAAKVCFFLRHILTCLQQPLSGSTLIYKDNEACINVVNACHPTDCTRYIETPYFRIQDWREQEVIKLIHIPGNVNNSDNLTKPLGWVLHSRHAHPTMGHFVPTTSHCLL